MKGWRIWKHSSQAIMIYLTAVPAVALAIGCLIGPFPWFCIPVGVAGLVAIVVMVRGIFIEEFYEGVE